MSNETEESKSRRYRKRRRAEQERETSERIVEAAVKLHGSVGPAYTTVSRVAEEAGVQRATVYRHFPSEDELFQACSAHFWSRHPMPDLSVWAGIEDPAERLHQGLTDLYEWFADTEEMLAATSRDAGRVPALQGPAEAFLAYLNSAADTLIGGFPDPGSVTVAAAGHAVTFSTWQSLVRGQGLEIAEAVELMKDLVESTRVPSG